MKLIETVWVDNLQEDWGNVYDRPYEMGSGLARHVIGKWTIMKRWTLQGRNMASFHVELTGGLMGWGKRSTDSEGKLDVYEFKGGL